MPFVTARSEQGSWIVGVGGLRGGTVIYDPSTNEAFPGPRYQAHARRAHPISLQGKVYAISRHPSVRYKSKFDFEPWFESLSFRKGAPCIYGDDCPYWKTLPPPPFFPCLLDPMEFRNPPSISVSSYAAFGSHILLSLDCKEMGTYAFDVVKKTWEKVCNESLPFVGQAVHLGGSLFVACSTTQHNVTPPAALFHMSITSSSTLAASGKLTTNLLSVLEYPVAAEGDPLPLFCSMGKGSFCSISLGSCRQIHEGSDDTQIILTSFEIQNVEAILASFQTESAKAKDLQVPVQVKHQNQIYKLHGPFKNLPMPVIASLSM
ncbi:hypothetical protein PR202_ga04162 [Eleusine coracana subsp. coracana]|uniref:Uncharacterized protein n=1 Tax=Eleusine coracana subsp. coracana TaxID=191504 RepID=A0AAV5BQY5_ELECO|nr:hypothetical protein PR202_ga04162 [Eleusine coracana subsp. coracana]